ncbi:MAG: RnfABCDGE type electron transport complex subunit G [Lachnospiraceae bacterium]|nr:RnfABCDGE type electron transport complex subunit G [Lachnospiraceae bacterium]
MKRSGIKGIIIDTLIIFAITFVAGGVLGYVYELTKGPIETQQKHKMSAACSDVFAEIDENGELHDVTGLTFEKSTVDQAVLDNIIGTSDTKATIDEVYVAKKVGGSVYGYVISVTTKEGYGGDIHLYMGVTTDEIVKGISILEIHETPGLGMRASEVLVPQFRNVEGTEFTVTKQGAVMDSEIDAITSATITSKAVTRAVNFGLRYFEEVLKGGAAE